MFENFDLDLNEVELENEGDNAECVAEDMEDIGCVAEGSELSDLDNLEDPDDLDDLHTLEGIDDTVNYDEIEGAEADDDIDAEWEDVEAKEGIEKFFGIADDDNGISFRGLLNSDLDNTQIKGYTPAQCARISTGTQNYCPMAGSGR